MKNNPFVIFVTAFLVVMGSGLAIAAIGSPAASSDRVDESSFAVDFGGEIQAGDSQTGEADPIDRGVDAQGALADEPASDETKAGADKEAAEKEAAEKEAAEKEAAEKEAAEKEAAEKELAEKEAAEKVEAAKAEEPKDVDDSTWVEVLAPANGQVFEDKSVAFEGKAEPGAKVYAGDYQADINDDGVWRIVLFLAPGEQTVQFKAIDPAGNRATDSVTVSLKTVEEKPKSFEFTVHQKYVESNEAYEKFYGTGTPGIGVVARSDFGVADARVGEHGEWWLPIEFSGLTESTTFPITISTTEGFSGTYWFTYVEKSHEFTVNQKYVESHEPFEKFYGTGTPGMGVLAQSEFGTEDARVGENGEWYLPIEFRGLTETKTFPITISTTEGFSGTYWFTYVAKSHEFSANQKYGSCSENPPYDVFWGTGVPGSVVEIGSPYGSARIEVGEGGWWEKKVFFEAAPVGETFEVVVGDSLGHVKTFTFTRTEHSDK